MPDVHSSPSAKFFEAVKAVAEQSRIAAPDVQMPKLDGSKCSLVGRRRGDLRHGHDRARAARSRSSGGLPAHRSARSGRQRSTARATDRPPRGETVEKHTREARPGQVTRHACWCAMDRASTCSDCLMSRRADDYACYSCDGKDIQGADARAGRFDADPGSSRASTVRIYSTFSRARADERENVSPCSRTDETPGQPRRIRETVGASLGFGL
jgi:hypothetical protein